MLNLIKADFYKLLRRKSFYICAAITIFISCLSIILINMQLDSSSIPEQYRIFYTGVEAFKQTVLAGGLFTTIMVSMFISSEFSFGTIKNIISSGQNRMMVYFSKLIMSLFITVVYTLFAGLSGFITGSILWGNAEVTRNDYLEVLSIMGLIILVEFAMESLYTMIGFVVRKTSGTITLNLVISILASALFTYIDFLVYTWFKIENFAIWKYWPDAYKSVFTRNSYMIKENLSSGLIACLIVFAFSTLVGVLTFEKRDIK